MAERPDKLARKQRADQVARTRRLERDIAGAYQGVWRKIRNELDRVVAELKAAEKTDASPEALGRLRSQRLAGLEVTVGREVTVMVNLHAIEITDAQAAAVMAGRAGAIDLLVAQLPPAVRPAFPARPLSNLVGYSADGRPLGQLLAELGPQAGAQVRKALVAGLARGLNPKPIARQARDALGGNMARATTIARTEVLRAYRAAALDTYRENQDVVDGWIWLAELDGRTCPVCVAMHGQRVDEDEFATHPSCRCTLSPVTKSWADIGVPDGEDTHAPVETGVEWFDRQTPDVQRRVLGPGRFDAYQAGKLDLSDMVERTRSERWGAGRRLRSLSDSLAA